MILALKYVLPKLLIGPVYHCISYFNYIELFKDLTTSDEDKESFEQTETLLAPIKNVLERVCKRNVRPGLRLDLILWLFQSIFENLVIFIQNIDFFSQFLLGFYSVLKIAGSFAKS